MAALTTHGPKVHPTKYPVEPLRVDSSIGILSGLLVILIVFASLAHVFPQNVLRCGLLSPVVRNWNFANFMGTLPLMGGLIFLCVYPPNAMAKVTLGIATALAMCATVLWSFLHGIHDFVKMSREAAWKIHIAFGITSLVFGSVHAGLVILTENILAKTTRIFGLAGFILVFAAVASAGLHKVFPSSISYDRWKQMHFLALLGYGLLLVHFMKQQWVFYPNVAVTALYLAQKLYSAVAARNVEVAESSVEHEPLGQHLFLTVNAPGFSARPGQWGYLTVGGASLVPHPFTLVPSRNPSHVSFFIKVQEPHSFTHRLATMADAGSLSSVSLKGPFGRPPNVVDVPTVFVLGGVGVTPALSLVAEASKTLSTGVPVYWSTRSEALLHRCAPLLEQHLHPERSHIHCAGDGGRSPTGRGGGLCTAGGKKEIAEWLNEVSLAFAQSGHEFGQIFVCGPPAMADAVKAAKSRSIARAIQWYVHLEEFKFLPSLPTSEWCCPRRTASKPSMGSPLARELR